MPVHRGRKWAIVVGACVIAALMAWFATAPYWAARQLERAVQDGDVAAFRQLVDFEAVRTDFKAQLTEQVTRGVAHSTVAALGSMIAGALADRVVDTLVTPEGLQRAILARRVLLGDAPASASSAGVFHDARLGYESWSRFAITLPTSVTDVKLVLARAGLGWKLVSVRVPLDSLRDAEQR